MKIYFAKWKFPLVATILIMLFSQTYLVAQAPQTSTNNTNPSHIIKKAYIDPDDYGAQHENISLSRAGMNQEIINRDYFGMGATMEDPVDWAAWQLAINDAAKTGKMIIAYGEYYFGNKQLMFPKYFRAITISGASCYINVTGADGSAVFSRPKPTDNSDANNMINAFVRIDGLQIGSRGLQVNRIGIDLGPTYNSIYRGIDCFSLSENIHLRFALNTQIEMCMSTNCIKGWTADMGDWPGASNSNSQSNHTSFNHCRFYADDSSNYAFGIYAASGCSVTNGIVEGSRVRVGCDYDAKGSTVVKDFTLFNTHFECVNGAKEAFIKLRMAGGIATIDKVFGQYAAYLVEATAANGTYSFVEVSHVTHWVPKAGKYFKSNGCNWALNYNDNMLSSATEAPSKFAGKIPAYCPGPASQCGGNSVTVNIIPR